MIKYLTAATALRLFSWNGATRSVYRKIGNRIGGERRRTGVMPDYYVDRVKRMLRLQKQHRILSDGDRILELGTGWLHWEALSLRLFLNIQAVLFDVWDNRQLGGLKNYLTQFDALLDTDFELSERELGRAKSLIAQILKVKSFSELYDLLGFDYVIDEHGQLDRFADESFQLVVSGGVLEHITRDDVPELVTEINRILKPAGWALHSIDMSDHLSHYDQGASEKMYLRFSEETWIRLFENDVQYVNRMQRNEWLELFKANGFDLIEEECQRVDVSGLRLATRYKEMQLSDLECTVLKVALQKLSSAGLNMIGERKVAASSTTVR